MSNSQENSDIVLSRKIPDGILRLSLNNPEGRNVLSEAMIDSLLGGLESGASNNNIKIIILDALGPVFCAGHDLKELTNARNHDDRGKAYFANILDRCSGLMQMIIEHPKPVIAEITGVATAAGCQLVASCDLAYASNEAKFCTPGVHIGLFCSTPMVALSRNLSRKHAMEMLLTGDELTAEKAAFVGLINEVIAREKLRTFVENVAKKIASKSAVTVATGKSAFYKQSEMPLSSAYKYASSVMVENMLRDDAIEGINAFIEKRKPNW